LWVLAAVVAAAVLVTPTASPLSAAKSVTVRITDSGFRLSAQAAPEGDVTFAVVNAGKLKHSFRIGAKKTPVLAPGERATLLVSFTLVGDYPYLSTVGGDVSRGLKGVFSIKPAKTITVRATDAALRLSATTAPLGSVGFVVRNAGAAEHDFRIAGKKTPVLQPRQSATLIVNFTKAGAYAYRSTVAGDVARGLKGTFTVTGPTTTPPAGGNVAAGKQAFVSTGCGACHALKAAGTTSTIGTNLDTSPISRATIVARTTNGKGTMPAYKDMLTPQQIQDIADFIVSVRTG
jgi:mono/diheme cytochrome c family protein